MQLTNLQQFVSDSGLKSDRLERTGSFKISFTKELRFIFLISHPKKTPFS